MTLEEVFQQASAQRQLTREMAHSAIDAIYDEADVRGRPPRVSYERHPRSYVFRLDWRRSVGSQATDIEVQQYGRFVSLKHLDYRVILAHIHDEGLGRVIFMGREEGKYVVIVEDLEWDTSV